MIVDLVLDRKSFFLVARYAEEVDEGESLAVVAAVDQSLVGDDCRRGNRTGCSDWLAQVCALQIFTNAFKCDKVKGFVFAEWTTDRGAVLFAMKIRQRLSIGSVCSQPFKSLEIKRTAMNVVCA